MKKQHDKAETSRVFGEVPAQVVSVDDPEGMLRVQVRPVGIFPDDVPKSGLPWAEYRLPLGARANEGGFCPVKTGDWIWVDFPYQGDTRRPRITGSMHFAPGKVPDVPHEAFSGAQAHEHSRTGGQPAPDPSAYHEDVVFTQHGISIQVKRQGAVSVVHRATGSEIAIDKDGNIIIHGQGDLYASAEGNAEITVGGNVDAAVTGNLTADITGSTSVTTETATVTATSVNLTAPQTTCSGNLAVQGALTVAGTAVVTGALSSATSVSDPTGTMAAMRGVYNTHTHQETGDGGGTTSTPSAPM